jgi:hypothetical protein
VIEAKIGRNTAGQVTVFTISNHGDSHVCAAVSMLAINTVNSIEALTKADFSCEHDEINWGYINFTLKSPRQSSPGKEAGLLLDAMILGLESVAATHPDELTMKEM